MADWRYLAQNIVTGEWLHTNLPLSGVEIEEELSGPGGINGSIKPELLSLLTNDGKPVLAEWSTAIYAESGGRIRGAGILVRSAQDDDGQTWTLECPGFTTYPVGNSYEGDWSDWAPDPFNAVREIWRHLQSFPDGDIGMVVSGIASGTTVGDTQPPPRPSTVSAALRAPTKGSKPVRAAGESDVDYFARVQAWEDDYVARRAIYLAAKEKADSNKERLTSAQSEWDAQYKDRKPYRLAYWEATDCGDEIDRLATEAPFDYVERHRWNADRTDIEHHLDLAHPMIGRRRQDLRFAVGENVAVIPKLEHDGDAYANTVTGLGKGDGRSMLRSTVGKRDGRLRRSAVVAFKDVGNQSRLRSLSEAELLNRAAMTDITEVVVWDHPNAPLGSWSVGDEVLIQAASVGMLRENVWVRIVGSIVKPDTEDHVVIRVINSGRVN